MSANRLTVAVPVYNGAKYLSESIESVLTQSFADFQLIICDDCSTDDSGELIRSFHDPRITYVRNPERLGLVENWNKCVSLSTGDYIYLWHQDDVMLPYNLRKKVEVLDAHPTVGFVHSNFIRVDEVAQQVRGHWAEDSTRDYVAPGYFFFLRELQENAVCCPSAMIRAECYARLGGYRKELPITCDYEFFMRLSLYHDVACIAEPLIEYRVHPATTTRTFARRGGDTCKQDELARNIILTEQADRIPDLRLAAEIAAQAFVRDAMDRATFALKSSTSLRDYYVALRYFSRATRLRPSVLARDDARWVLKRLLLGPAGRSVAHRIKRRMAERGIQPHPLA